MRNLFKGFLLMKEKRNEAQKEIKKEKKRKKRKARTLKESNPRPYDATITRRALPTQTLPN